MIKQTIALLLTATLFTAVAQAKFHSGKMADNRKDAITQTGGFQGSEIAVSTVKNALEMSDDTKVRLKGQIEQHLGSDKYLFKDSTGIIEIEVDDKRWMGQTVTPNDTVEIYGKIDKDMLSKPEVDVKRIMIVK